MQQLKEKLQPALNGIVYVGIILGFVALLAGQAIYQVITYKKERRNE